jgi:hypothetical protein
MKCTDFSVHFIKCTNFHALIAFAIETLKNVKKKTDLAPKTKSNPNFESRFGFFVKFYPIPELRFEKKCSRTKKNEFIPVFFISGSLYMGLLPSIYGKSYFSV